MKPICRLLTLTLALMLPLCAWAEDDSRRWVEDITKMKSVPAANPDRLDHLIRQPVLNSADAASAALAWAETNLLHPSLRSGVPGDLALFVMTDRNRWLVTISHSSDTVVLTLDAQGRLLGYECKQELIAWYGSELPLGTDEAILSYIEHFARQNGCESVTGYEQLNVQWNRTGYDVRVTAAALLDGVRCTFTLSLETMAFTAVDCPLPAGISIPQGTQWLLEPTPVPTAYETFQIPMDSGTVAVRAIDRRTRGDSFSMWPDHAMPREEVFAIALQALMDEFGLTLEDVTAEPFLYGYDAESAMHKWQLNFDVPSSPMDGYDYSVYIRDSDGAVLGVWGPEEANG